MNPWLAALLLWAALAVLGAWAWSRRPHVTVHPPTDLIDAALAQHDAEMDEWMGAA